MDDFCEQNKIEYEFTLKVLEKLQRLEPTGVFSKKLRRMP